MKFGTQCRKITGNSEQNNAKNSDSTITLILTRENYCGELVSGIQKEVLKNE